MWCNWLITHDKHSIYSWKLTVYQTHGQGVYAVLPSTREALTLNTCLSAHVTGLTDAEVLWLDVSSVSMTRWWIWTKFYSLLKFRALQYFSLCVTSLCLVGFVHFSENQVKSFMDACPWELSVTMVDAIHCISIRLRLRRCMSNSNSFTLFAWNLGWDLK